MAFCQTCGAQVSGGFCGNCGTPAGAQGAPQQQQYQQQGAQAAGMEDNVACALCYLVGFITGIIFLVLAPYNTKPNIRYHAWQSIGMNVALIVIMILFSFLTAITGGILALVLAPIAFLIWLCTFILWLFLMFKAYQGEGIHLPVIGDFARKQAGM